MPMPRWPFVDDPVTIFFRVGTLSQGFVALAILLVTFVI